MSLTYCTCHLYCLDCICREVLFSHLECKFLKGITIYDTPIVPLNYIWMKGFWPFQPSGHQRRTVLSSVLEGVRTRPIAAETSMVPLLLLGRPYILFPWYHLQSVVGNHSCIQRCTRKVKAKLKPKLL